MGPYKSSEPMTVPAGMSPNDYMDVEDDDTTEYDLTEPEFVEVQLDLPWNAKGNVNDGGNRGPL